MSDSQRILDSIRRLVRMLRLPDRRRSPSSGFPARSSSSSGARQDAGALPRRSRLAHAHRSELRLRRRHAARRCGPRHARPRQARRAPARADPHQFRPRVSAEGAARAAGAAARRSSIASRRRAQALRRYLRRARRHRRRRAAPRRCCSKTIPRTARAPPFKRLPPLPMRQRSRAPSLEGSAPRKIPLAPDITGRACRPSARSSTGASSFSARWRPPRASPPASSRSCSSRSSASSPTSPSTAASRPRFVSPAGNHLGGCVIVVPVDRRRRSSA